MKVKRLDEGEQCAGECPHCGALVGDAVQLHMGMYKDQYYKTPQDAMHDDALFYIGEVHCDLTHITVINALRQTIVDAVSFMHGEDLAEYVIYATDDSGNKITHQFKENSDGSAWVLLPIASEVEAVEHTIQVTQTIYKTHEFTVTATDDAQAEALALAESWDWDNATISETSLDI